MQIKTIVIGAGAWGTSIASLLAYKFPKLEILLWARDATLVKEINFYSQNFKYLPDFLLCKNVRAVNDLNAARGTDLVFIVIPCQTVRSILEQLSAIISANAKIIICSKGIEDETSLLMNEIAAEVLPKNKSFFLSGPNFANEIMQGLPCAANIAGHNIKATQELAALIATDKFKVFPIIDLNGIQVMSALKNMIAIFTGLLSGKGFGLNAKATAITNSLLEIKEFCYIKGSQAECLLDFCGIGDLMLTCYGTNSRNTNFGINLAQSKFAKKPLCATDVSPSHSSNKVIEGKETIKSAYKLAEQYSLKAPITRSLYEIIYLNKDIDSTLEAFFNNL